LESDRRAEDVAYQFKEGEMNTMKIQPTITDDVLLNPGMGILYVLRGMQPVRFDQVDPQAWFLRERLCNKLEVSIPWSLLEPEEGVFAWEHPQWEGCFKSWVDRGFKVALKVRGMASRGTLYDDGTPAWVFKAGAKFIDEDLDAWVSHPIPKRRVPVYWDPVYLEKSAGLIRAMGERYNGKPWVEFVQIAHMGQWGEMHVSMHTPVKPWFEAGYSPHVYLAAHRKIIDMYVSAFPDTQLSQALGPPIFTAAAFAEVEEIVPYLVNRGIMLKYGGLGWNWESNEGDPFVDESIGRLFHAYFPSTKMYMENFNTLRVMRAGLDYHLSYWHRGGEATGLGMSYESDSDVAAIYRFMARHIGFRLALCEFECPESVEVGKEFLVRTIWQNQGSALCYRDYDLILALVNGVGDTVWEQSRSSQIPTSSTAWNANCVVEERYTFVIDQIPQGHYELRVGMQAQAMSGERLELPLPGRDTKNRYPIACLRVTT
jgi:hypothetical protein